MANNFKETPKEIRVDFTSGFAGGTEIFVNDTVNKIGTVYNMYTDPFNTFGVHAETYKPVMQQAFMVPANAETCDWAIIEFDNGLVLKCIPGTLFLMEGCQFKPLADINVGDAACCMNYKIDDKSIKMGITKVIKKEILKPSIVPERVYFCCTQNFNLLLPSYIESEGILSFVDTLQ